MLLPNVTEFSVYLSPAVADRPDLPLLPLNPEVLVRHDAPLSALFDVEIRGDIDRLKAGGPNHRPKLNLLTVAQQGLGRLLLGQGGFALVGLLTQHPPVLCTPFTFVNPHLLLVSRIPEWLHRSHSDARPHVDVPLPEESLDIPPEVRLKGPEEGRPGLDEGDGDVLGKVGVQANEVVCEEVVELRGVLAAARSGAE